MTAADAARQDDAGEVKRLREVLLQAMGNAYEAPMDDPYVRGVRAVIAALPVPASDAALARVLALHHPRAASLLHGVCVECGRQHPCPTVRAARGES